MCRGLIETRWKRGQDENDCLFRRFKYLGIRSGDLHALDHDAMVNVGLARPPLVGAPPDQRVDGLAARIGTTLRQANNETSSAKSFDVIVDGIGNVLYNDHVVEISPLVVSLAACTRREISFFLPCLDTIIPVVVLSVKFGTWCICVYMPSRLINLCDRVWSTAYALVEPDHLI